MHAIILYTKRLFVFVILVAGLFALLSYLSLPGCFTPPALARGLFVDEAYSWELYPEGTERIELPVEEGVNLQGLFLASDPGAPILVHLLESNGSVASMQTHYALLLEQCADLGYSSLIVDYTGVGASDGERCTENLKRDALAIWDEARQRANGDASRVFVRGISIGTLAAATLLDAGIRPGGVVLIVPVFSDSAVSRFASFAHGSFLGWACKIVFSDIVDIDLCATLEKVHAPLLVISSQNDFFLDEGEMKRLNDAVCASKGTFTLHEGGHFEIAVEAHALLDEEYTFFREHYPGAIPAKARADALLSRLPLEVRHAIQRDPNALERLEALCAYIRIGDPLHIAAASQTKTDPWETARYLWRLRRKPYQDLTFEELCATLTFDDPGGRIDPQWVLDFGWLRDFSEEYGGMIFKIPDAEFALYCVKSVTENKLNYNISYTITYYMPYQSYEVKKTYDIKPLWKSIIEICPGKAAAQRMMLRTMLKASRIPERVRILENGEVLLEVKEGENWKGLPLISSSIRIKPEWSNLKPEFPALGRKALDVLEGRKMLDDFPDSKRFSYGNRVSQ